MSMWRQLTRGLRTLFRRNEADRDISDEVEQYLEEATASFEANGLSRDDARHAAKRELGNLSLVREEVRDYGWENLVDTLASDVRYAARRLRNSPGFTVAGALTLALGIGASTAIFSAVNPVLLDPLPYPEADRIMAIRDGENESRFNVTFGTYREVAQRNRSFAWMAAVRPMQLTLTGAGEAERIDGQYVGSDYFRVLGVPPVLGRDFQPADDQLNSPSTVIISSSLWHRHFNADPAIVGQPIVIQDTPVTVLGVMPSNFENVLAPSAEIWSPLRYDPALPLNGREWGHHLRLVGRLRPGVHADQAGEELDTIARTKVAEFPRPAWSSVSHGFTSGSLQDDLTSAVRPTLLVVMGAAILLLVIACVNVTNLLLARGDARRTELAVRAALGASGSRITRQLLTESLLLALIGGALGIGLAYASLGAIVALSPFDLPRAAAIHVDGTALVFALVLTTLTGALIGVVPALHRFGRGLHDRVQQGSPRLAGGRQLTRRSLVVVQLALALVLLVHAGLLLRTLQHLFQVPPGFDASNVLTMQVQTSGQKFRDATASHQFFERVLETVRTVPGVSSAAWTNLLPLTGGIDLWGVLIEGVQHRPDSDPSAYRNAVSPGYLETMGIALKDGRVLNSRDAAGAPFVVVISESLAKNRFAGLDPIGRRLKVGPPTGPWFTVVGVVADVMQDSVEVSRTEAVYMTSAQWTFADSA